LCRQPRETQIQWRSNREHRIEPGSGAIPHCSARSSVAALGLPPQRAGGPNCIVLQGATKTVCSMAVPECYLGLVLGPESER
jgi:hypothetical protein